MGKLRLSKVLFNTTFKLKLTRVGTSYSAHAMTRFFISIRECGLGKIGFAAAGS
jgi:hypothetical protein